jgi:predicted MFS family arabinose efflux permease
MNKVLGDAWSWSFYIASLLARLPLSFIPVAILLGTLNQGVAGSGALLAAIALGAALAGLVQGPLWDRLPEAPFMSFLSVVSIALLVSFSFLEEGLLAVIVIFLYGFFRPQTSTVTRSVWMKRFSNSSQLSSQSVSLDIASTPVIGVVGPLLAGVSFQWLGFQSSIILVAIATLTAALAMVFLIAIEKSNDLNKNNNSSIFNSMKNFFTHPPLITILVLAIFSAAASGVTTILLSANLESRGELDLLSPMLAISAAAIIIGAYFFKKFIETPGNYLHIFLLIESIGLFLYPIGFISGLPVLWLVVFLAGLAVAPLGTILYILIESRSQDGDRAAAFSLLATAQFLGISLGQLAFSNIAEATNVEIAMLIAASIQFICFIAWIFLPYGMKKYRPQKTFSWWPENLEEIIAEKNTEGDWRAREEVFNKIYPYLKNELENGTVPDLPRVLRNQKTTPSSIVGIIKITWDRAWHSKRPTFQSALECGQWLDKNGFSLNQIENTALYLGFEHRDFIEEEIVLDNWEDYSYSAILFAVVFHTSRLRASRMYLRLREWFKEPVFIYVEKERINKIVITLTESALGVDLDKNYYQKLWQEAKEEEAMSHLFILLDVLNLSLTQKDHPKLLVEKAIEYLDINKDYGKYVILAFKARGERLLGELDQAKQSILEAYSYLPFSENHKSNALFVEQFDIERGLIDSLIIKRDWIT